VQANELVEVGAAGRGVAVELDRARVGGLHEVLHHGLPALAPGADLVPADELDGTSGIRSAPSGVNSDATRS